MTEYRADHYYRHDEMTTFLKELVEQHPRYASLEQIGTSVEEREIWLVTLTDDKSGTAEDKPAYWIDANTHASEVAGNAACLYTINYLLEHRDDASVSDLLSQRTLYIAPRLNPDGAEYCLEHNHYVRSARRPYPDPEPTPGLIEEDVDGDGFVLQMRVEANDGAWRRSEHDARLMVPRLPWDTEGPFYHLYAEGTFEEEVVDDPRRPMLHRDPHGLDFNRNYPYSWKPEADQMGAGPYPLSEPETRAVVDFMLAHRNICGALTYHTYSGVLLRPYTDRPDTDMPDFDLHTFEAIGKRCEELTGYPCLSGYHEFRYDPKKSSTGVFDDWAYDQYGVHTYTMELWAPQEAAGVEEKKRILDHWMKPTEEDLLKYLVWNDEELDGEGFEPWRSFDHPQLGRVEIGGWKFMYTLRNPPPKYLADICHKSCLFTLDHARCGPIPELDLVTTELEGDLQRLTVTMRNDGYLPTYVTMRGRKLVNDLHLELTLSEGLELVDGKARDRVKHLAGMANHSAAPWPAHTHHGQTHNNVAERHWMIRGSGVAEVVWRGDRIGKVHASIEV